MKKIKELLIPILWNGWDQPDTAVLQFHNVEFYEDFGPFSNGEEFSCVTVDHIKCVIEAYSEDGTEIVKTCKFKAIPIND